MPYTWNSLKFELPPGTIDQTIVTLVDNADQPSFTLTISGDSRGAQGFGAYVDATLADLARSLPGYAAIKRAESTVGGKPAITVEHRARSPGGQAMRQRQTYVDVGSPAGGPVVAIVALTCADKPHPKADAAFEHILRTLA